MRRLAAGVAFLALAGCWPEEDRRTKGYNDGYSAGYDGACDIPGNTHRGDWEDTVYSQGFVLGVEDGVIACLAEKQQQED